MLVINEARVTVEKEGQVRELAKETPDRIAALCSRRGPHAQVAIHMGTSLAYGEMKIDVSVTLTCDQNEFAMDETARIALEKSEEYMNLGLVHHGLEPVPFEPALLWRVGLQKPAEVDRMSTLSSGRGPLAHVGILAGTSQGYGEIKVKSSVRLACDQTTEKLDEAAELALVKTNEYTSWGLSTYQQGNR